MQKIPECRSMNFSIYEGMLNRYKDSEDIRKSYESRGLNGTSVFSYFLDGLVEGEL